MASHSGARPSDPRQLTTVERLEDMAERVHISDPTRPEREGQGGAGVRGGASGGNIDNRSSRPAVYAAADEDDFYAARPDTGAGGDEAIGVAYGGGDGYGPPGNRGSFFGGLDGDHVPTIDLETYVARQQAQYQAQLRDDEFARTSGMGVASSSADQYGPSHGRSYSVDVHQQQQQGGPRNGSGSGNGNGNGGMPERPHFGGERPSSFYGMEKLQNRSSPANGGENEAGPSMSHRSFSTPVGYSNDIPSSSSSSQNYHQQSQHHPRDLYMPNSQAQQNRPSSGQRSYAPSAYSQSVDFPSQLPAHPPGPLLDHSHLQPGKQAKLLNHAKTLELYRENAKKTNDPEIQFEFATFLLDVAKDMGGDEEGAADTNAGTSYDSKGKSTINNNKRASSVPNSPKAGSGSGSTLSPQKQAEKQSLMTEAISLLSKLAQRGHVPSQYYLADCYTEGIGTGKGKQAYDKAFPLFTLAAKHGHPDAAFRTAQCCENGWGCRKDASKAVSWYRKAATQGHCGAMYRLGVIELNGELNQAGRAKDGFKWLKRAAELADASDPKPIHELALLHEKGIENIVFVDYEYAAELLARAAELGYSPSAYKLGECYEYGRMGCPQDAALSIHYYNIAAQQNHKEACFALTAWYLVGSPGVLPQSDTEAYLWAKKAAQQNLAKAEYAVGYFTEVGVGTYRDLREALNWFRRAKEHGDKRAQQRIAAIEVMEKQEKQQHRGGGGGAGNGNDKPLPAPHNSSRNGAGGGNNGMHGYGGNGPVSRPMNGSPGMSSDAYPSRHPIYQGAGYQGSKASLPKGVAAAPGGGGGGGVGGQGKARTEEHRDRIIEAEVRRRNEKAGSKEDCVIV